MPAARTYLKIIDSMTMLKYKYVHAPLARRPMGTDSGAFPRGTHPGEPPGRKPVPTRAVLEAVLWILNTGAQWHVLPQCYPNDKTVHRRFQQWCEREVLRDIRTQLANTLREEGDLDERESFIDATFAAAKGGGEGIGPTRGARA